MRKPKGWGQPCPNPACDEYKLFNRGNVKSIARYATQSGKRRIFQCKRCGEQFSERRDTVFFDLRTPEEKVMIVLKLLLCQVELTAISFALGVTQETTLEWLRRASEKADEINQNLLRDVKVTQVELDELWSFVLRKRAADAQAGGESPEESRDAQQWVWVSFAPEFRLLLATYVGPRTFHSALKLIQMTALGVLGVPVFFSDGFSSYLPALLEVYHQIKTFPHTGKRGPPKQPVKEPHPDLVDAQLVKVKQQGRLRGLTRRVCLGAERLAALGLKISTSFVERFNLTLRHALAPLTRKCLGFCRVRTQLRRRVTFYQAFYNFARPHQRLRQPLPGIEPADVPCFQPKWQQPTPAMAAGLTDPVWSFRELLTAKFEPIHYQNISP
jgi:IS1 family transposase/transposase-like protein